MSDGNVELNTLPWTGERYLPEVKGDVELEHLHRYLFAGQVVAGLRVLDIASGEGYGSAMLAKKAAHVTGVDISGEAVSHAKEKYKASNLEFREGSCAAIPLPDACIDVVVSFETIEHHYEHEAMMQEIKRVLKPGGVLVISCPDKLEYSDKPGYSNEYHVKELYRDEFEALLAHYFKNRIIFGQRATYGSFILREDEACLSETYKLDGENLAAIPGLSNAVYLIAIATDSALPSVKVGLLDQDVLSINEIAERDTHIRSLVQTIESLIVDRDSQKIGAFEANKNLKELESERDGTVSEANQVIARYEKQLVQFNRYIKEHGGDHQLEDCQRELAAVYRSKSWRVTSPLRWMVRVAKVVVSPRVTAAPPVQATKAVVRHAAIAKGADLPTSSNSDSVHPFVLPIKKKKSVDHGDFTSRILLVSQYYPSRAHAGGLRIFDLYALIAQHHPDVQIDLLTHHRPSIDWSLDDVNRIFHNVYLSPTEELTPEALLELRGTPLNYDVIDLQFHQSGHQINAFRNTGQKIVFSPMESLARAEFLNLRRGLFAANGWGLRKVAASLRAAVEEVGFVLKADEVVCVSDTDAAFLRKATFSRNVQGLDTGVSQFEFSDALRPDFICKTAESRRCNVLYVAYFGSETNLLALRWYLDNVHPLIKASVPEYRFTVVGRGDLSAFSRYKDDSVEFVGEVAALAPHIQEARLGIAPALTGSGFRGKVNQYSVLGIPSVISPIAFNGLAYQDGANIFVAEKPAMFAERCITLLTNNEINNNMGQAARKLCLTHYTWESKWPIIRKIYNLA